MDNKICTSCTKEKPVTEFHRRGIRFQNICKDCRTAKERARYNSTGKKRTTSPSLINKDNIPALSDRVVSLENQLRAKASRYASDKQEADDIYSAMVEAILTKSNPTDSNARILTLADWSATEYIARKTTYGFYVEPVEDGKETSYSISTEDEVVQKELSAEMHAIILQLPTEYRQVVSMLAVGHSQKEIAKTLHVSEPVVSKKIQRIGAKMLQLGLSLG